jgi:hypothetical protein
MTVNRSYLPAAAEFGSLNSDASSGVPSTNQPWPSALTSRTMRP